tara:strand:+ start:134 stop:529 length:396 start_codon:yes stop_codon:yes gene_type:complete
MSHFAEVTDDFIDHFEVKRVLVVSQEFIDSGRLGDPSNWIQTSYNSRGGVHYAPNSSIPDGGVALRKNYAGIGYTYDPVRDAFIAPKSFNSWSLNELTCLWEPPVPFPGGVSSPAAYEWNEDAQSWDLIEY